MNKFDELMNKAFDVANLSNAKRLKVGAVIVNDNGDIISFGENNMPKDWDTKVCEYNTKEGLVTKDELIHAESNAILKCARDGIKLEGCTIFITDSPCLQCAKLIYQAGIKTVVYKRKYRLTYGLDFLKQVGVVTVNVN